MDAMRFRILVLALLPLALAACGGNDDAATLPSQKSSPSTKAPAATPPANQQQSPAGATAVTPGRYIAPSVKPATKSGKAPAVILLPDTNNAAAAAAEATKLSQLGIATFVVAAPKKVPDRVSTFDRAVTRVELAITLLANRGDVDRNRIGIIGEGVGAHVGAVAIGRNPGAVAAAVLADVGGVVVPSRKYAPARWLGRANGIQLLFQRDLAKRAMSDEEARRLVLASPPGTLMEQYDDLGAQAEAARDAWMKIKLLST